MAHTQFSKAIAIALLAGSFALPVVAHTTQVSGDVGATWHVEPNHAPKAGEPAQVWIALTRQGGSILPLAECDCQLAVYAEPRQPDDAPLIEPPLEAIAAERYEGIPGADLVFPQPGQYELQLSGAPKTEAAFQPFEFRYSVIVATGSAATAPSPTLAADAPTAIDRPESTRFPGWAAVAVGAAAIALAAVRLSRTKPRKR